MKRTREQIKAELMKKAEEEIDRLLSWEEESDQPTLTQFEDQVLATRRVLSEAVLAGLMTEQEKGQPSERVMCPTCGQPVDNQGAHIKHVETRAGSLRLKRQYVYCPHCRAVFFPLDEQLQLREAHWSEGVARLVTWLEGQAPFRDVAEVLERVGQIHISSSTTWREGQHWGEAFQTAEERQSDQVNHLPSRDEIIAGEAQGRERMGAAMDGAMMYILGEGWKEFKVGCIFDVFQQPTFDKETLEWEDLGHAAQITYVAHLGGPEILGQKLWAEAYQRHWTQAQETQVLGDAAAWIWNLAQEHFYDSRQTVDWCHATEHLGEAAACLYGEENTPPKQGGLNEHKKMLFQGQAAQLVCQLQTLASGQTGGAQETLLGEAGYFEHNQHRMNYLELREEGWLVSSGVVESGAKQFKDRFTGPGMRWSRSGAERLLPVRAAVMSHNFDEVWRAVYNSPNN